MKPISRLVAVANSPFVAAGGEDDVMKCEPLVSDMLADPIVRTVMAYDGVTEQEIEELLEATRARLAERRLEEPAPSDVPFGVNKFNLGGSTMLITSQVERLAPQNLIDQLRAQERGPAAIQVASTGIGHKVLTDSRSGQERMQSQSPEIESSIRASQRRRNALMGFDPEHPLIGPHPTD